MICDKCGKEFEGSVCLDCNAETLSSEPQKKEKIKSFFKRKWFIVAAAIAILLIIIGVSGNAGKSEAAKNVSAEIKTLTDISAESDLKIERVERLYDGLSEKDKKQVKNYKNLQKARNKCDKCIAEKLIEKIDNFGNNIDLKAISDLRNEYASLTDNQKTFVSNYDKLDELEKKYYSDLISKTEELINKITYSDGAPTEEESKTINDALNAYNELDETGKDKVSNYAKLETAIKNSDKYIIVDVQKKIDEAVYTGKNSTEAKEAYNKLSDAQKNQISGYDKFEMKFKESELNTEIAKQQLRVTSTKYVVQDARYKALYPDMLQVVLQNDTQYDIKNAVIAFTAWDSNKLPVKIVASGVDTSGGDYVRFCNYNDINLVPGAKFGNNSGFSVDEKCGIKYFKAIVVGYETFDGNTWENPLYTDWEELYAGKKLASE